MQSRSGARWGRIGRPYLCAGSGSKAAQRALRRVRPARRLQLHPSLLVRLLIAPLAIFLLAAPAQAGVLRSGDALLRAGPLGGAQAVAALGDVNGDGLGDVAVLAPGRQVLVVFGRRDRGRVDPTAPGAGGFLVGPTLERASIGAAGDVNGDGLADLAVGTPGADGRRGSAFVVFGKRDTAPVRLAALGDRGFRSTARARTRGSARGWPGSVT